MAATSSKTSATKKTSASRKTTATTKKATTAKTTAASAKKTTSATKSSELTVTGNKKIETLRKEFNRKFPYLRLGIFYSYARQQVAKGESITPIDGSKTLASVRRASVRRHDLHLREQEDQEPRKGVRHGIRALLPGLLHRLDR